MTSSHWVTSVFGADFGTRTLTKPSELALMQHQVSRSTAKRVHKYYAPGSSLDLCTSISTMEDDLSLYDDEESLFESGASVDETVAGSLIGAREDVKLMNVVRVIVILVLLTIAFVSAETVFVIATIAEQDEFRAGYNDATEKLTEGFLADMHNKLLTAASFSTELISGAKDSNWPNVSYQDFELRSSATLRLSKSSVLSFSPIVLADKREAWESYTASVYASTVEEQRMLTGNGPSHISANFTSGVTYFPSTRVVSEGIYRFAGPSAVTQAQSDRVTFPFWQMAPSFGNSSTGLIGTLFDQASNLVREQAVERMILNRGPVTSAFLYQDSNGTDYANYTIPRSFISYPIYQNLSLSSDIVASLNMEFRWEAVLSGILVDYGQPLTVVVQNACGGAFTYNVTGLKATFAGKGALYQKDVDGYTPMNSSYAGFAAVFAAHGGAPIASESACFYKLNVYATKDFKKSYLGTSPQIYKGIVLVVFLAMVVMFIAYDCLIEKRQKNVVQAAERSDKIVRSLFPEAIRDRLYEDAIKKEEQHRAEKNHWKNDNGTIEAPKHKLKRILDENSPVDDSEHGTDPIADFFPNCSVLFADIAGFTAWSSEREPAQVFTLLENIYKVMDKVAKRLKVFKVETVGDCYVAATGIPLPQENHVVLMVRFARTCVLRVSELTKRLESQLGPGTGELSMRFGIHSGPVTAGVLRGQKARFQLFGDTMNMAARMESTGMKNKIQLSSESAKLLMAAGHQHWVIPRPELVQVKGKGECQTYWLALGSSTGSQTDSTVSEESQGSPSTALSRLPNPSFRAAKKSAIWAGTTLESVLGTRKIDEKLSRLVDWNVEVLVGLLKRVVARANAMGKSRKSIAPRNYEAAALTGDGTARDEIRMVIELPDFDQEVSELSRRDDVQLDPQVVRELHDYVSAIASGYKKNEFHNFEHASHVILSSTKLLKRIVAPSDVGTDQKTELTAQEVYEYTYGISNDPLTQFAVVFSALIHDVGHKGVPNGQLGVEEPDIAEKYDGKSLAEQRSVDIAWQLLMLPHFENLRRSIYTNFEECQRFRALLVNSIMATDIFDKDLKKLRNDRWDQAFHGYEASVSTTDAHRKATIVIEHIIQASDVAHTMQHWHIYVKWNERLFREMYMAFLEGRSDKDPSEGWYAGEIWFYDNYVIPLAGKLRECGVFGVSSDEYLNYAQQNRFEWERKGQGIVASMKARIVKDATKWGLIADRMDPVVEDGSDESEGSSEQASAHSKFENNDVLKVIGQQSDASIHGPVEETEHSEKESISSQGTTVRSTSTSSFTGREVLVPKGKLGITIDSSQGYPIVYTVDSDSPLAGKLHPGDVILSIDDIDTTSMVASAIAALIGANCEHERRFRVQGSGDGV